MGSSRPRQTPFFLEKGPEALFFPGWLLGNFSYFGEEIMKHGMRFIAIFAGLWLVACAEPETTTAPPAEAAEEVGEPTDAPPVAPQVSGVIGLAINDADRPSEDKARDNDRRPDLVLAFYGVGSGMAVVEYIAGA